MSPSPTRVRTQSTAKTLRQRRCLGGAWITPVGPADQNGSMHEELSGAGARIIRNWIIVWFVVVVAIGAGYSLLATVGGGVTVMVIGLVAGALVGACSAVYLLVRGEHHAIKAAFPKAPSQYDAELTGRAEKYANALGIAPPTVYRFEGEGPNVAALPWADGSAVMVSSAAQYGLTPGELDSLMALQLSLLHHPKARRNRRAVVASNLVIGFVAAFWLTAVAIGAATSGEGMPRLIIGVFMTIGAVALLVQLRRRIRWGWGLLSDGVAVATTRHPGPLVHGLRRVASHNGDPVPTKAWLGQGDHYWVVPVRKHSSSSLEVNGTEVSKASTEMLNDGELLMRASLVEDVCVRASPATKARWDEAAAVFRGLTRGAAEWSAAPGEVDGVVVTILGMVNDDIGPVHGSWVEGQPPPWPPPVR